ncbi:unnamed protein product, partial [Ectocarpus fasciculatus]
ARPAGRREPDHPERDAPPEGPPHVPRHLAPSRGLDPGPLPFHLRALPEAGAGHDRAAAPGGARGALLLRRRRDRPDGADDRTRTVRCRGGRLYRASRRQPPGVDLLAGGPRLGLLDRRPPGRPRQQGLQGRAGGIR